MRTRSESQKYDKYIEAVKIFINECACRSEICNATCDDKKRILDENEDLCFDCPRRRAQRAVGAFIDIPAPEG